MKRTQARFHVPHAGLAHRRRATREFLRAVELRAQPRSVAPLDETPPGNATMEGGTGSGPTSSGPAPSWRRRVRPGDCSRNAPGGEERADAGVGAGTAGSSEPDESSSGRLRHAPSRQTRPPSDESSSETAPLRPGSSTPSLPPPRAGGPDADLQASTAARPAVRRELLRAGADELRLCACGRGFGDSSRPTVDRPGLPHPATRRLQPPDRQLPPE